MTANGKRILIIGGGPSGMAAAVQLSRQGYEPIIFESARLGGLLLNAGLVENYPGFPDGIVGEQLANLFKAQIDKLRVAVIAEEVTSLDYRGERFVATTPSGEFIAPTAIIATGTVANLPGDLMIPGELVGRVHTEVYAIRDIKNQRVAMIGAGDAAFDYALTLAEHNQVTIINRSDAPKCLKLLWGRAQAANIQYLPNTEVQTIGSSPCGCVLIQCRNGSQAIEIGADTLVIAIGRHPNLKFMSSTLADSLDDLQNQGKLHLIGDVKNGDYRQTGIAVGDGIRAAMHIDRVLRGVSQ